MSEPGPSPEPAWEGDPEEFEPPPGPEPRAPWIPALVQLADISPRDFAEGRGFARDPDSWREMVRVPPLYTELLPGLDPSFERLDYVTARVSRRFLARLREDEALRRVCREIAVSPPLPLAALDVADARDGGDRPVSRPSGRARPGAVVVGAIDDGIAFAHEAFREPGGTRVESIWIQDGRPPGPAGLFGPLAGGAEHRKETVGTRTGIDDRLLAATHAGLVDEDELYRDARVVGPGSMPGHKAIAWRRAHGTHVLDLAANYPLASEIDSRIVAVQLPISTTALPVASTLAAYVIEGLWYILVRSLDVAARLGSGPLPVVINLSYGTTAGPHDGTHIVERAIDAALPLWRSAFGVGVEMAIASGNSHLDRLHAEIRFGCPGEVVEIPLRVQPDDRTPSLVELWLPPAAGASIGRVKASLVSPDGSGTAPLTEGATAPVIWPGQGTVLCDVGFKPGSGAGGRGHILVRIKPTVRVDGGGPVAPHGLWRIRLENVGLRSGDIVHARIRRDEAPYGYPRRGRQSYFDDPAYDRHDAAGRPSETDNASMVKRAGAMNAMATGREPTVIGGLLMRELRPARYSAGGPITPPAVGQPHRQGPDALAASDGSRIHGGVLAAGARSGSAVAMDGTSVAAPLVARWIAGELAAGRSGDRAAVAALATNRDAGLPPGAPSRPPPPRGGAGRIILRPTTERPRDRRFEPT